MPATPDTTTVAHLIAGARSLTRAVARKPRDFAVVRDVSRLVESDLDEAMAAIRRIEAGGPLIDHVAMQEAIERTVRAFLLRGMIKGMTLGRQMRPGHQVTTVLRIHDELDLTNFAIGLAMELAKPGSLDGESVNIDDMRVQERER